MKTKFLVISIALFVSHAALAANTLGFTVGAKTAKAETNFAMGFDWTGKIEEPISLAAYFERASSKPATTTYGLGLSAHLFELLKVSAIPSIERSGTESEFVLRTGVGVEKIFGSFFFGPVLNIDWAGPYEGLVYGLSAGALF